MARSIWNGVITFGFVSIPVRLSPATTSKDIAFNELHTVCKSRLKRQRWCPNCQKEVDGSEVMRGYEYAKGQYVEMKDEDFEKVPLPSKHTIAVERFVKGEQIDPVFYDSAYVLEPEDIGKKPFALFLQAISEKGMTAVARITVRKKEQLCALRPFKGNLMLETLYDEDEVRVDLNKELGEIEVSATERKMADAFIELLTGEFVPSEFKDNYREALLEVIQSKLDGKEVIVAPEATPTQVTDLMEALRASIAEAQKRKAG